MEIFDGFFYMEVSEEQNRHCRSYCIVYYQKNFRSDEGAAREDKDEMKKSSLKKRPWCDEITEKERPLESRGKKYQELTESDKGAAVTEYG